MSAVALTVAARDRAVTGVAATGIHEAASTEAPPWNAAKLNAMEGRMLAESIRIDRYVPLWNAGKLDAMQGRMLAENIRVNGYVPLWNAGKTRRHGRPHARREHPDSRARRRPWSGRVAPRSSRRFALRFTRVAGWTSSASPSGVCTAFGRPP